MIFAEQALLPDGWARNVRLSVTNGLIATVTAETVPHPADIRTATLLPAVSNLHSHSFQRAMAGMTEHRAAGRTASGRGAS